MPDTNEKKEPTPNDQRATVMNPNSREHALDAENRRKQAEENKAASKRK
ncbi:hypothetical protein [Anaeromyxobacter oryzae]|uniref:Uncharacterized protein n=1 Tax=Anaeromyxobacter oryzae TaxID=2918170 RepID=A0ABM7WTJ6_9BACT|nr:hypothetical protein [Anaeromyxobacter oryzae]BDG02812.1 hypothetical protein AMOR_18080 [Anaeromyxobacter oryzae]